MLCLQIVLVLVVQMRVCASRRLTEPHGSHKRGGTINPEAARLQLNDISQGLRYEDNDSYRGWAEAMRSRWLLTSNQALGAFKLKTG